MDWNDQPELLEIFHQEMEERSRRLIAGAAAMQAGELALTAVPDLVRDAHTLKGSSRIMGLRAVGEAAALLERAWRTVQDGTLPGGDLAATLLSLAELLAPSAALEREGVVDQVVEATARASACLDG
ncbi:MAG: Hpt domain-containing protein, partial [Acidimicrobiia bacterium]